MGMTTLGIIKQKYSEIEPRPFSRFTQDPHEIKINQTWEEDAIAWHKEQTALQQDFDKHGYPDKGEFHG